MQMPIPYKASKEQRDCHRGYSEEERVIQCRDVGVDYWDLEVLREGEDDGDRLFHGIYNSGGDLRVFRQFAAQLISEDGSRYALRST
jgi:hypothetical protein